MADCPINHQTWLKFVGDNLSHAERKNLISHLDEDCEQCERFFEDLGSDAAWKGFQWVGEAVTRRMAEKMETDLGSRDEIFNSVIPAIKTSSQKPSPARKWFPVFIPAAFVAVMALLFASHDTKPVREDMKKGAVFENPSISLHVAVLKHPAEGAAGSAPQRGIPGERYDASDTLFFRYELGSRGYVYLARSDGAGIVILDAPDPTKPVPQEKGIYDYREGDKLKGLALRDLKGRQVFVIIASVEPLDVKKDVEPLVRSVVAKRALTQPGVAADGFEIMVEKRT